jgi:hypothetical protein
VKIASIPSVAASPSNITSRRVKRPHIRPNTTAGGMVLVPRLKDLQQHVLDEMFNANQEHVEEAENESES